LNLISTSDVKVPCLSSWFIEQGEQMKFLVAAALAILIGVSLSGCITSDPDNKPPYGQANGKKSDR